MRIGTIPGVYTRDIVGQSAKAQKSATPSFTEMLETKVKEADQLQHQSDKVMDEGSVKGAENIHESMIKMEEADLSMRLLVKARTKAVEAYQEIMRMQF